MPKPNLFGDAGSVFLSGDFRDPAGSSMNDRLVVQVWAAVLIAFALSPGQSIAQDATDIGFIESAVQNKHCQSTPSYNTITPKQYSKYGCRTLCIDHKRNGGDCGESGLVGYEPAGCDREIKKKNDIIEAYNRLCDPNRSGHNAKPQQRPSQPSAAPSPLERALQRQSGQAQDADKLLAKNKADAEDFVMNSSKEKAELDDEVRRSEEEARRLVEEDQRRREAMRQEQMLREPARPPVIGARIPGVPTIYRGGLRSGQVSPVQTIPRNLPRSGSPPRSSSSTTYVPNYSYSRPTPTQMPVPSRSGGGGTHCPAGMACTIR